MTLMLMTTGLIFQVGLPAYAQEECGPFTDQNQLSKIYNDSHLCGTCSGQQNNQQYCAVLNNMLVVDREANKLGPFEPILIPHRGVWGGIGAEGPAENTMAALIKAKQQGYRIIEIDAMVGSTTKGSDDGLYYKGDQIKMSHYFDMYAYGGESGVAPRDVNNLSGHKMRKRNGNLSTDDKDKISSIRDAIIYARDNKLMLTIDPKNPPDEQKNDPDENEYAEIILSTLITAEELNALGYITIKSELTPKEIRAYLQKSGIYFPDAFCDLANEILWSPILNKNANVTLIEVNDLLKQWTIDSSYRQPYSSYDGPCIYPRSIMTFEVQIYNEQHWTNNEINYNNISAKNIIDYVEIYSGIDKYADIPSPRRATLWSVDPMGSLGTFGRMYNWKFIGNNIDKTDPLKDDLRSDPVFILSRDGAKNSAIITDRPDVYESILD